MKRSTMLMLGATGVLVAGAWLGRSTGPLGQEEPANIYDSVSACITANAMSREACETEFQAASDRHLKDAPRFTAQNQCEAEYGAGQCKPATIAGTSYFLPALAGFMVAQRLMNQRQAQPLLPPRAGQQPCPPGATAATHPACAPRSTTSSSSGAGAAFRSYSTTRGASVSRSTSSSRVIVPRSTGTTAGTVSRSPSSAGSVPSVSRGGFGSTARSTSSSSSS